VVIGVSPDSVESHRKFAGNYGLTFNLISDPEKHIIQSYGVWVEKKNYGKAYMGLLRSTFIISEEGIIETVFPRVDTKTHANQIIKKLNI
jgi:peroxiredoxin Q/BCP